MLVQKDKRKFPRIRTFKLSIGARLMDMHDYKNAEVINLSAGGLCFLGNFVIGMEDTVLFRFPFKSKSYLLSGRVIRVNGREIGVRFTNSEDEIRDFVDHYNKEVTSLLIEVPKHVTKLIIPGYTYDPAEEKGLDNLLEIDE